ncbi:MAG TPA: TetR/AcrR family transcriptional regulator [Terriglobales bacterium]|nr:TetR/AcrR family transcriptional regulator [Terriglobales bacterium]
MNNEPNSSRRILDAALQLFSEKGYEATSTREICELAGITKPTLYYFYKSKEGVYRELVRNTLHELTDPVDAALSTPGPLREKYYKFAEIIFEDATRRPQLWRFIFSIVWATTFPFRSDVHDFYNEGIRRIAEAANDAAAKGEIRQGDTEVRMLVLMGALAEALSNYLVMGRPKLTRSLANSIIDTVFDGWSPVTTGIQA